MSGYSDIRRGYDRLSGKADRGLIYTCNCGWIDLGHAFAASSDPTISAANLWRQLQLEGPDAKLHFGYFYPPNYRCYNYPATILRQMRSDRLARFANGQTGFRVTFRQEMSLGSASAGITRNFLVRHGLDEQAKQRIALSIFMLVSLQFEGFQYMLEWGGIANSLSEMLRGASYDSGYSQEDLVSNLIGFFVAVGIMTQREAIRLCHPATEETARQIWQKEGPVGSKKNRTFLPILSEATTFDDHAAQMCRDDCVGQPRQFPTEFQQIRPMPFGTNFIPLHD